MSPYSSTLVTTTSINEIIRRYPSALPVLNGFGIDTCCGGAESLAEAARSASIPLDALMAGLTAAIERAVMASSYGTRECGLPSGAPTARAET